MVANNDSQLVLDSTHQKNTRQLSSFLKGVPNGGGQSLRSRFLFDCSCLGQIWLPDPGCFLPYLPPAVTSFWKRLPYNFQENVGLPTKL